jgi:uncharacterized protein
LTGEGIVFKDIQFKTSDDIVLSGWYTPPQNHTVILLAHGYGTSREEYIYAMLAHHGYGVLSWDFRAHGRSGGEVSTLGYYEVRDVEAAMNYALAQPDVKYIGGWGGSMGGATMILSAARFPQIKAIVVDSAFPTLEDEIYLRLPIPVFRNLVLFFAEIQSGANINSVRPVDVIRQISPRQVFIIQGERENMIPLDSAKRLYDAAGEPKYLWTKKKAYHLNMYFKYPKDYEQLVIDFYNDSLFLK